MSPETNANDHVPLEFLLGARVKHYFPESSNSRTSGRSVKAKRILAPSTHPRKREEQARNLLRRVLEHEHPPDDGPPEPAIEEIKFDKSAVLKALTEILDEEHISDPDGFQLSLDDVGRSPVSIKTLTQMRDDDLKRQQQRDNSFHGYEQNLRSFLDVSGAATRIPLTTTRQLRDLKLNVVAAKKKLENERKQELLGILQKQQAYTRTVLQHQLSKTPHHQKHPRTVSTNVLALDSIENLWGETDERKAARTLVPLQVHYEKFLVEEDHSQRPTMTTLNFDARVLSLSPAKDKKSDTIECEEALSTNNYEDLPDSSDADDDSEHVRRRLGNRQRELFSCATANGLFLGGGFISKKTKEKYESKVNVTSLNNNSNNRLAQAASERDFLENVLGAHSASILPLAEANKPALRRREASAGRRHPKHHHKPPGKK